MSILFEIYDRTDPMSNMIAIFGLQPDRVVFVGESAVLKRPQRQNYLRYGAAKISAGTEAEFLPVNPVDTDSVCAGIGSVIEKYGAGQCVVDLTGDQDLLLYSMGIAAERLRLNTVIYRPGRHALLFVGGSRYGEYIYLRRSPTVSQFIASVGGTFLRHGHGSFHGDNAVVSRYIRPLSVMARADAGAWRRFVRYFQHAAQLSTNRQGVFIAPFRLYAGRTFCDCPIDMFCKLRDMGLITRFTVNRRICQFDIPSEQIRSLLMDAGMWLEIYIAAALTESGLFNQIQTSYVLSWDSESSADCKVENEIDVIAVRGMGQMFISCKTGSVDQHALFELASLTKRFGSRYAMPILVSSMDSEKAGQSLAQRAERMGIVLISGSGLDWDALLKRIRTLAQRWGQ